MCALVDHKGLCKATGGVVKPYKWYHPTLKRASNRQVSQFALIPGTSE